MMGVIFKQNIFPIANTIHNAPLFNCLVKPSTTIYMKMSADVMDYDENSYSE